MASLHRLISRVCVLGGGPAGLASAIALSQVGFRVTVIDCAQPPIDKACGEGLMPDSVAVLARLGIQIPDETGSRFHGIRFGDSHSSVVADFPWGEGIGIRRVVLHELLLRRAEELGVECIWSVGKAEYTRKQVTVGSTRMDFDFVIAADGQNSITRRTCGLDRGAREKRRYGFRRHYRMAPWSQYVELYWAKGCQVYVTPVAQDEVCIVSMSRSPELRLSQALHHFPTLRARLADVAVTTRERGALSVTRKLPRVFTDDVALVGDASGSVDAITGEGICLALKQSLALAQALKAGNLAQYQSDHRKLSRRPQLMSALLLTLDTAPFVQRRALASLSRCPQLFASLLAVHVGEKGIPDLLSFELLSFCREFLAA